MILNLKNQQEYRTLAKELREFYFGNATIDEKVKDQYLDMTNDRWFFYDIQKSIRLHQTYTNASAFYFRYSFEFSSVFFLFWIISIILTLFFFHIK